MSKLHDRTATLLEPQMKPMTGYMNSFLKKKKKKSAPPEAFFSNQALSTIQCPMLLGKMKGLNNKSSSKFIDNGAKRPNNIPSILHVVMVNHSSLPQLLVLH
jgi:hypothetical protein